MKRLFKLLVVVIIVMGLCGCGTKKESVEQNLCKKLDEYITKYNSKELTFNDLAKAVENESSSFCTENKDNNLCRDIQSIKNQTETDYTLQDCSTLPDNPKSLKELCESTNNLKKESLAKKEQVEDAYVSELNHTCQLINEK